MMSSWEIVFGSLPPGTGLDVKVEQLRVHASQGWGFVTCVEKAGHNRPIASHHNDMPYLVCV